MEVGQNDANSMGVFVIFLAILATFGNAQDIPDVSCQNTIDSLIMQLNGTASSGGGNGGGVGAESKACACACASGAAWQQQAPPTPIHIDMGSLLSSAVKKEVEDQNEKIVFRLGLQDLERPKYYDRSNLNTVKIKNKNYFISRRQALSWLEAVAFCRLYDMHLLSVETQEKDVLIQRHLRSMGVMGSESQPVGILLSANKVGLPGWRWLGGASLNYTNWGPGMPQHPDLKHCMGYWRNAWADFSCTFPALFVCEENDLEERVGG